MGAGESTGVIRDLCPRSRHGRFGSARGHRRFPCELSRSKATQVLGRSTHHQELFHPHPGSARSIAASKLPHPLPFVGFVRFVVPPCLSLRPCFGEAIPGTNIFRDIAGGRSGAYETYLRRRRQIAMDEMI